MPYDIMKLMDSGRETYKNSRGNYLAKMAFNTQGDERKSALGELAGIDYRSASALQQDFNEQDKAELAEFSTMFLNAPDDVKPQMYARGAPRFAPKLKSLGIDVPQDWKQAMPFFQQLAGAGGEARVQSTQVLQDGTIAYMDNRGNLVRTNEKARENYGAPIQTSTGYVAPNKNSPTAAPLTSPREGAYFGDLPAGEAQASEAMYNGSSAHFGVKPDGSIVDYSKPEQYQPAPKAAPAMTPYQSEVLAMAKAKESQAQADRKAKLDNANAQKGDAARKRNEAVVMSVDDTLTTIDRLEKSAGYKELGTAFGDIKIGTPLIRNDAKDANATLQTLAGQIALSTMANLKTLSSAGATGFGALTAPELKLLQNSIATLQQDDVSNSQIVESIKIIKDKMQKIKASALGGQSAPSKPANGALKVGRFTIESN